MAADLLNNIKPSSTSYTYNGSTKEVGANRVVFGEAVNLVLDKLSKEEAAKKVMVIDSKTSDDFLFSYKSDPLYFQVTWRVLLASK